MKIIQEIFDSSKDRILFDTEKMHGLLLIELSDGSQFRINEGEFHNGPILEIHSPTGLVHIYPRSANAFNVQAIKRGDKWAK